MWGDRAKRVSGARFGVGHVANTWQLDDDDAEVLMRWAQAACRMRDELGYQQM